LTQQNYGGVQKNLGGPARECLIPWLGSWFFERKWRLLLQEWSVLHCRFNSLVGFDWGKLSTCARRSDLHCRASFRNFGL